MIDAGILDSGKKQNLLKTEIISFNSSQEATLKELEKNQTGALEPANRILN